jgi:hypothetical protein
MSLAIMTTITTVMVYRYPESSIRLNLANDAQTVALLLREAQLRGSSVDSSNSAIGGYGVYFDRSTPRNVVLFGDVVDVTVDMPNGLPVGNGLYASSTPVNETKSITTFPNGYTVEKLCVGTSFPFTCLTNYSPNISSLTVSFTRPNPQPNIYVNNGTSTSVSGACIELRSPRAPRVGQPGTAGHIRSVQVYNSGMIRTSASKCDNSAP